MDRGSLTELEFILLNILIAAGPSHPYALGKAVEERGGKGVASLGGLYKALHRLEEAGYVEGRWEKIDPHQAKRPRRRSYQVSGTGEQAVEQAARRKAALYPAMTGGLAWRFSI